jgi:phosphonoacetaldehyde hydrolase
MNLTGVIFDWAGTVIDHGSRAPVAALQDVFAAAGMPITIDEARRDMGIAKKDHIRCILATRIGATPPEAEVEGLYADFLPKQTECLGRHSQVLAGVPQACEALRSRGIRLGSTTGYTRPMLEFLVERAREQGFAPDCALCPQDVPGGGRPAPWMCYLNAIQLKISPLWSMVKIGDTPSDIEEGLNAGMWTIGITRTGNEAGLTEEEWNSATSAERREVLVQARTRLDQAGAHYLIESVADCIDTIDEISGRIRAGEKP